MASIALVDILDTLRGTNFWLCISLKWLVIARIIQVLQCSSKASRNLVVALHRRHMTAMASQITGNSPFFKSLSKLPWMETPKLHILDLCEVDPMHNRQQYEMPWRDHGYWTHLPLQWRHNGCDGLSNYLPRHCLLNRLFSADQRKRQCSVSLAFVCGEFTGDRWILRTNGQ